MYKACVCLLAFFCLGTALPVEGRTEEVSLISQKENARKSSVTSPRSSGGAVVEARGNCHAVVKAAASASSQHSRIQPAGGKTTIYQADVQGLVGGVCTSIIQRDMSSKHLLPGDSLDVVKWDFGAEFGLSIYGGSSDYFAKRFDPQRDFLKTLPYDISGASLLLIDFDPPEWGEFAPGYELYVLKDKEGTPPNPIGGGPPTFESEDIITWITFDAPFCTSPPPYGCGYILQVDLPDARITSSTDPVWLALHFAYTPEGYGPVLGSDAAPNFQYEPFYEPYGGVHQVYEDSYYWNTTSGDWYPVDQFHFNYVLYQHNNLCMDLNVSDAVADGRNNIFRDDEVNMSLVPVQYDIWWGLLPVKAIYQGDSLGLEILVTNNSADPMEGDSICCFGVEVIIEDKALPDTADIVYDVLWLYDLRQDSLCIPNGGGYGISTVLYPLYTVDTLGIGAPWTPDSLGEYLIRTVLWRWDGESLLWDDQSPYNDTLDVCILSMPLGPDDYEPNNLYTQAVDISCGDSLPEPGMTLTMSPEEDIDWFAFYVPESMVVHLDIDAEDMAPPSPLDASMVLYDSGLDVIVERPDDPRGGRDPYLRRQLPPGVYYLQVTGEANSIGPYRLVTCCEFENSCDVVRTYPNIAPCDNGIAFIADMAVDRGCIAREGGLDLFMAMVGDTRCRAMELRVWPTFEINHIWSLPWYPGDLCPRGIAFDDRDETVWCGDWITETLYRFSVGSPDSVLGVFSSDYFGLEPEELNIAGLAIDHNDYHLWAVTNGNPDAFFEFDIGDPTAPTLIQGPLAVPWQVPSGCPPGLGAQPYSGAGLAYDDDDSALVAVNQFWGGLGNDVEIFGDVGMGTPEPIHGIDISSRSLFAWGIAHVETTDYIPNKDHVPVDFFVTDIVSYFGMHNEMPDDIPPEGVFQLEEYGILPLPPDPIFVRGDAKADGDIDIFDGLHILSWLGGIAPEPPCLKSADVDDNGLVNLFDAIREFNWLGGVGNPLPSPCCDIPGDCGEDPTPDALTCNSFPPCGWNPQISDVALTSVGSLMENSLILSEPISEKGSIVVPVTLTTAEPLVGISFDVEYDGESLTLKKVDNAGLATEEFDLFVGGEKRPGLLSVVAVTDLMMDDELDQLPAGKHRVAKIIFEGKLPGHKASFKVTSSALAVDHRRALRHRTVDGVVSTTSKPTEFQLHQNSPNPFNPETMITYSLPIDCMVTIEIYTVLGQLVNTVVNEHQKAGYKAVRWDSRNRSGHEVASGIYLYRISAGDFVQTKRMILLR